MQLASIIKPHALGRAEEIICALRTAQVKILKTKVLWFTQTLIEILYDHMSTDARRAIGRELVEKQGLALLLDVESIERLLEIVGTESDPRACAPSSIRARFGIRAEPVYVGADLWWQNAFHRPIDIREAQRDLFHLFGL
jgi:nucleoside diphosphate kinase